MQDTSLPSICGVTHRMSHGNLHISLADEFALHHSSAVLGLVEQHHTSCDRIFIDVRRVEAPTPLARIHFKATLSSLAPDPQKIFFKGRTGFSLALDGNRILIVKPHEHSHQHGHDHHGPGHVCRNNCPNCKCRHKRAD